MVEKISEVSMNVAMNGDSTPDDNALINRIAKKKKQEQGGEPSLLAAMLPPSSLVQLTTRLAQGGRLQKTEKQAVKEDVPASLGLAADTRQAKKGDGVAKSLSATHMPVDVATNNLVDSVKKFQQPVTAQQSQTTAVENSLITNKSAKEAETGRKDKQLRAKDDFGEVRPLWHGMKQAESTLPKHGETTAQSKNNPATLQQLKSQASMVGGAKGGNDSQTLEVNYQFQRWSGDHSVRISVPTEARREGNVTLLPSDARAADVLLRNMGHLTGINPDILRPEEDRDEQQQRRQQQQQQDEDQE